MKNIRQARLDDLPRIAEIIVFCYRLNFYHIFKNDDFYFNEMQVTRLAQEYECSLENMWVYDDGCIKGVVQVEDGEIKKLFVEPVLQGQAIGSALLEYAANRRGAGSLWALERNTRAITFYERHGFCQTGERKPEEGTEEYLVRLKKSV